MPFVSSLGRALVGPGPYPETVMDRTVQTYKKERKKAVEQDAGEAGGVRACLNYFVTQTPLGIDPKSLTKILS